MTSAAARTRAVVAPSRPSPRTGTSARAPFPLKPVLETLEPRLLLSADAFPAAADLAYAPDTPAYSAAIVAPSETAQTSVAALASGRELVFVDPRVPDSRALLAALLGESEDGRRFEIITLDAKRDGIVQVTAALKSRMQIDAVHFITHGSDGAIQLGGTLLDAKALAANLDLVGAWGNSLKEDADLLIYGCDLAASARGRALIDWLAEVTGADVAASTDPTGHVSKGGDWDLEYRAGAVETPVAASAAVQAEWAGLLATPAGGEFRINSITSNTQNEAAVARDAVGNFVVAWTSSGEDGSGTGVYAQRYDAAGVAQGSAFRVNTTTADDQQSPAVAMDDAGNFVVVWQSNNQDGSSWGVYAQRYNAAGVAQGSEFQVNMVTASDQQAPAVAMNGAGDFVIAWQSNGQDGDNWGIFARRYNAAGVALDAADFQINQATAKEQQNPAVAMDAAGNFVVAWESKDQDGDNFGVYARRYDAAGFPLAGEFRVNTAIAKEQQSPAVAMAPDGRFVVAWQSKDQDGNNWGVYAQRYDAAGGALGGEFRVNTYTSKEQQSPAVAMAADGRFTIAWQSNDQDGTNYGVYAQTYSATGTTQGPEFRVSTTTSGAQQAPAIAMNRAGLGHYVVAWDGNGSSDPSGIYAQRYTALADGTILDLFNAASYSGNDGAQNWKNDWQELGETGGPGSGTVRVEGGSLRIGGDDVSITGRGASRTADLSGATTATLTFSYRRQDINGGGGSIDVEVSPDGSTWILLANYSISSMASSFTTASFDISAAISANTMVRFVGSGGTTASYFRVDYVQIEHNGAAVNQAPILDAAKAPVLDPVNEDAGAPVGAVGTLVSQLVDLAVPAGQLDNVTDPDVGGVLGIAVTGADATNGTWWYSLDDGASWSLLGAVNDSSALLLAADGTTRVYFQANPDFNGMVANAITFRAWDQSTGTNGNVADTTTNGGATAFSVATDTASIAVNPVNDPAVVTTSGGPVAYTENEPATPVDPAVTVTDVDNATLASATVRLSGGYVNGEDLLSFTPAGGITGVWDAPSGTLMLTGPATLADWQTVLQSVAYQNTSDDPTAGARTIELVSNDGTANSAPATRTVNVDAVNDVPVANNVAASGNEDAASIAITLTGTDVDDLIASFRVSALPANGLLYTDAALTTLAADSTDYPAAGNALTLYFVPTPDWNGSTSFQFTTIDTMSGTSAAATATITVAPVNDAPTAGNDGAYLVDEDATLTVTAASGVLGNDADIDSAPITAVLDAGPANAAAFTLNPDGSFSYTPRADFFGVDTFTYRAFDGTASSNVAIVSITVNPLADNTLIVDTVSDLVDGDVSSLDALLMSKGADGFVSLREAIVAANNSLNGLGPDLILFNIAGPGVHTINLGSALPAVTDAVIIDGWSEPDFAGTPVIELNGAGAGLGAHGLTITAGDSTVRGLVINGFNQRGISISGGGNNTIAGNYIGTDASGSLDRGNGLSGIFIDGSAGNTIGGGGAADRNVISGNNLDGVSLNGAGSTGNLILGNYVGINATGTAALGNGEAGVDIDSGASGNTVAQNVVSGNGQSGIELGDPGTSGNLVLGNFIGTNAAGTAPLGNAQYGIWLAADGNVIGGTGVGDRNVISGNAIDGIFVDGASGNIIQGNYIGTDALGTFAIGNAEDGIWLDGASDTLIGGTAAGAGNLVSGNDWSGIALTNGGADNLIQGNAIGVDAAGTGALANLRHGVQLLGSSGTLIGGTAAGAGNVIASNGLAGVSIEAGTGHSVLGNTLRANGGLGIDIGNDGVSANDLGDLDGGPNQRMNAPVIYSVLYSAGNVTITGEARAGATLQFFAAAPDPSGRGEGETFVGSDVVTGLLPGSVDPTARRFSFTFAAGPLVIGDAVTATATDSSGNTSEFSANAFTSGAPPGVTVTPTSGLVTTEDGGTATFTVVLDSQPGADVTIALSSSTTAEGTVAPAPLVFTTANWNVAQTVTVTGVADFVTDGAVAYSIVLDPAASADAGYDGIDPADVSVSNLDGTNDAPVNNVPGAQIGAEDTPLVFSTGNGNRIWISDSDAGPNPLEVTLSATQGALTLAGSAGLTFTTGTGTGDVTMTFTGTLADINAALDGMGFLPNLDYIGAASVSIATNDLGGSGSGGPQSASDTIDITVVAVNDAPTIDLDADDSSGATGADYQRSYTEQVGPRLIVDAADAVLGDVDSTNLASLSVTITNADFDGAVEFLSADTTGTPLITATYNAGTGVLTLNGAAPVSDYELALRTIRYENTSDAPSASPRVITFVASDGGAASNVGTATVTIAPVNDDPMADIVPASYSATEGTPLVLAGTGLLVGDIDAGSAVVTAALWVTSGLVTAAPGATGAVVSGSGTPSVTLTGTLAQINDLLAGNGGATLSYVVGSDSPPATDDLTLWIDDGGATGSGGAGTAADWATIDVTAVNDAPVNTLPGGTTAEDTPLVFSPGGGNQIYITDVDAGTSPMLVTLGVTNGDLTLSGTAGLIFTTGDGTADTTMTFTGTVANINAALDGLTFTPVAGFNGPALLTINTDDQGASGLGGALSDADLATITVTAANDPPAGTDTTVTTPENTAHVFTLADFGFTDPDVGDSMSGVRIDSLPAPAIGTLTLLGSGPVAAGDVILVADITAGNLVFTPTPSTSGNTSFSFSVRDFAGAFDLTPSMMTVNVGFPGITVTPTAGLVTTESGGTATFSVVLDTQPTADVTIALSSSNSAEGTVAPASLVFTSTDWNLPQFVTVTGVADAIPDGSVAYTIVLAAATSADPGYNGLDAADVSVTNTEVNAAPTVTIVQPSYSTIEGSALSLAGTGLSVDDIDAVLPVTVTLSVSAGILNVGVGATGATAAGAGTAAVTFTGTVAQINDLLAGNLGATITYLTGSDSPPPADTLTLSINDNHPSDPRTASASVAINISALNDAPVNTLPGAPVTAEDTPLVFNAAGGNQISITDVDAGGAPMLVTLNVSNGVASLSGIAGLAFSSGDGTADSSMTFTGTVAAINSALNNLVFTPNLNYNGLAFITLSTNDQGASGAGGALSDTDLATITVTSVNDAPAGTDQTVSTNEDTSYTFSVSNFGFIDVDIGDAMSEVRIDTIALPPGARLQLNAIDVVPGQIITATDINAGLLVFTPVPDATGTNYASFIFTVRDTQGFAFDPMPNTMTIDVAPVNDAPVITSDGGGATAAFVIAENTTYVTTVAAGDIDLPPQTLTYSISGGADAGLFTINGTTGVLTFAPAPNFEAPADSGTDNVYNVTVRVADGAGGSDTQALTITVTDADDAPFALADGYAANEDAALTVAAPGTLANDYDEDGSPITATLVSGPTYGSLAFNADGSFVYTPNADFFGTDSFVYRVSDGALQSGNATVTIAVNGVQDAPTAANGAATTAADTAYTFTIADFNYSDVDGDPLAQVEITALPASGTLFLDGVAVTLNQQIDAADIAAGRLTFVPPPSASGVVADQFGFRVSDGIQYEAGTHAMAIGFAPTVTPPPPPPDPGGTGGTGTPPPSGGSSGTTSDESGPSSGGGGDGAVSGGSRGGSGGEGGPAPQAEVAAPDKVETAAPADPGAGVAAPSAGSAFTSTGTSGLATGPRDGGDPAETKIIDPKIEPMTVEQQAIQAMSEPAFREELDKLRRHQEEEAVVETRVAGSVFAVSTSLSVGYVLWLLRGGVLLTSLLSSLPAWRIIDPLPVLSRMGGSDEDEDDDSLEELVDRNSNGPASEPGRDADDADDAGARERAAPRAI